MTGQNAKGGLAARGVMERSANAAGRRRSNIAVSKAVRHFMQTRAPGIIAQPPAHPLEKATPCERKKILKGLGTLRHVLDLAEGQTPDAAPSPSSRIGKRRARPRKANRPRYKSPASAISRSNCFCFPVVGFPAGRRRYIERPGCPMAETSLPRWSRQGVVDAVADRRPVQSLKWQRTTPTPAEQPRPEPGPFPDRLSYHPLPHVGGGRQEKAGPLVQLTLMTSSTSPASRWSPSRLKESFHKMPIACRKPFFRGPLNPRALGDLRTWPSGSIGLSFNQ